MAEAAREQRKITVKLFCPSVSKIVQIIEREDQRLDLGFIARAFGLDPNTLKLNGHFISRGVDFLASSVTWKSLIGFFSARGLSTGGNDSDALLVHGKLSTSAPKSSRVMNAIFLRELEKNKRKVGETSSPVPGAIPTTTSKDKESSSRVAQPISPPFIQKATSTLEASKRPKITITSFSRAVHSRDKDKSLARPTPPDPHKKKRKAVGSSTTLSFFELSDSEDDSRRGHPQGPSIYPCYTSDTAVVGQGPNNIAQGLLDHLPSKVDARFLNSLEWDDLITRTSSTSAEHVMYLSELIARVDQIMTSSHRHLKKNLKTLDALKGKMRKIQSDHGVALRESQNQFEESLRKKDAEMEKVEKKHEAEVQKLRDELRSSQVEVKQAHHDLEGIKAQLVQERSSFKDDFLKSQEFHEICGPKAFHFLEVGFTGAVDQFKANDYPPLDASSDFISLEALILSLPPDA